MNIDRAPGGSSRRTLSLALMGVGILLLLVVPTLFVLYAFSQAKGVHMSGTLVILSSVGGMALLAIGAALRD